MKVAAQIRNRIKRIPKTKPFGYADLGVKNSDFMNAAKALERLQKQGVIKRLSKGLFYVPSQTVFGELGPDYDALLKRYLFKNGKRVAYETGYSLYNNLGLTTQMAFTITIATKQNLLKINEGSLKVRSVKSYVEISEQNYFLLGYLDALKDIKRIPDSSVLQALRRMSFLIADLSTKQQEQMLEYALSYPPRVRALLGAIFENLKWNGNLDELKNSLNPLSSINLGIKESDLPSIKNWYIK